MPDKKVTPIGANITGEQLIALSSIIRSRQEMAYNLGQGYPKSVGGFARDVYEALGYIKEPSYSDYYSLYQRQDIAKPIINAPVDHSWRLKPLVTENIVRKGSESTEFEREKDLEHHSI